MILFRIKDCRNTHTNRTKRFCGRDEGKRELSDFTGENVIGLYGGFDISYMNCSGYTLHMGNSKARSVLE